MVNPHHMLEVATRSEFTSYPNFENRKGYPGIRAEAPIDYSHNIADLLVPLIQTNFGISEDLPMRKSMCAFSLTTMPPSELGPLQRTPHFDASTPNHFAILLYLCNERHGGTGFYRHNATGLQQITESVREHYLDTYYAELNARQPAPRYFDNTDAQFTLLGLIPAKFNRMVVYRGSLLHSACINPHLSLSSDPRAGRLTVNSFYDF
ncbi:MAG: hypothetical protein H7Y28_16345 [Rhodoferax sp.]|nr:hypothetical protein [Rhodoferax sp.]